MESTQLVIVLRRGHFPLVIEIVEGAPSKQQAALLKIAELRKEMPDARIYAASVVATMTPAWEYEIESKDGRRLDVLRVMLGLLTNAPVVPFGGEGNPQP